MKEKSGPMKAINTLIVILFVSAMVGMVYFLQTRPPICVFIVGAVFFFMGMLGIFTNGLTLENSFLLIFPFAGAIVMLISASFIWSFSILEKNSRKYRIRHSYCIDSIIFLYWCGYVSWVDTLPKKEKRKLYLYCPGTMN